jgi:hypothetical protein
MTYIVHNVFDNLLKIIPYAMLLYMITIDHLSYRYGMRCFVCTDCTYSERASNYYYLALCMYPW